MITAINESLATEESIVRRIAEGRAQIKRELAKVIRGQDDVIEQLLIALLAGGHALITGAPAWRRPCSSSRPRGSSTSLQPHPVHAD